jgi:hypothetical protein
VTYGRAGCSRNTTRARYICSERQLILAYGCRCMVYNLHAEAGLLHYTRHPPQLQARVRNILSSTLAPGPLQPKHSYSVLYSLVQHMHSVDAVVPDIIDRESGIQTGHTFTLRAWPIMVTGDGSATAEAKRFKRADATKTPCHICHLQSRQVPDSNSQVCSFFCLLERIPQQPCC